MLYTDEQKKQFANIVNQLKEMQIDGESTQELLKEIGQEEQMLQQLMMSQDINTVNYIYLERCDLESQNK